MVDFRNVALGAAERIFYGNSIADWVIAGIPKLIEAIVREQTSARFERCHLKLLGESALQFELSYFVQQPKLNSMLDLQHTVNLRIIGEFRRLGIEFGYPTQRVVVEH
jgi:small-conductance mechanosensitive channel